ncbi:hypothetical protein chiPu_0020682 [Chiloscyllium punctatum]|uniref:UDENN domain-containing protein n=1 Tax=Chiloscyllium punctatum TaxID=137246 RepID=A0A401RID6_CHIPU|nr:hypothetical protein [Chiloscyllium punctatum]
MSQDKRLLSALEQHRSSLSPGDGASLEITDPQVMQGSSLTLRCGRRGMSLNRVLSSTRRSLRLKVHSCVSCVSKAGIERSVSVEEKKPEQDSARYPVQFFFEYLVVVSLKNSGAMYEPQIAYQFPKRENLIRSQKEEEESLLKAIPLFCFPDDNAWAPLTEYESETFSFVLTNIHGSRKFGYCRRLLPRGGGPRLPEVFCIISCLGCFGLFSKVCNFNLLGMNPLWTRILWSLGGSIKGQCLMVDLQPGVFLQKVGDEHDILPHKLYKELLNSLQSQRKTCQSSQELNDMVTNAFVLFFVKVVGHYSDHLKRSRNETTFQEQPFRKSVPSKSIRRFLKSFMATQMFSLFVQELEGPFCSQEGFFEKKIKEYRENRTKVK